MAADETLITGPANGYRFKADGELGLVIQLRDAADGKFRTWYLENGQFAFGPPED
jgi:hypothetical protein